VVIGAPQADPHGSDSGAAYVVFGRAKGFPQNLDLSELNGQNGFELEGSSADDKAGCSVSGAGDINGDGFGDIIIGSKGAYQDAGAVYVVFGKASSNSNCKGRNHL
jgi:hypothetical protein